MWAEAVLELEPVGNNDANIVWEWHIWDHLIQDVDPDFLNYGVVSEHPELQDVNYGAVGTNGGQEDLMLIGSIFNSIAYNEELDQIALSSRHRMRYISLIIVQPPKKQQDILAGTQVWEGDYLYRWGNPQAYGRGNNSDHLLGDQHSVNWIPEWISRCWKSHFI